VRAWNTVERAGKNSTVTEKKQHVAGIRKGFFLKGATGCCSSAAWLCVYAEDIVTGETAD
jgi:hypothetical protein